jgi:hypothetical protein
MFATRFLAVILAVLLDAEPSFATSSTVGALVKFCSAGLDNPDYSYCLGVMDGGQGMALTSTVFDIIKHHDRRWTFVLTIQNLT